MKIHIGPYRKNRRVDVRIDKYDTWNMDSTLALIICPMLVQLKESKHGAPDIDLDDVPELLHPTRQELMEYTKTGSPDPKFFTRWAWILDEMVWAFEQKTRDWWEEDYLIQEGEMDESIKVEHEGETLYQMTWKVPYIWDDAGRKAHQERMSNGFRLFGKYLESLWD